MDPEVKKGNSDVVGSTLELLTLPFPDKTVIGGLDPETLQHL